MKFVILAALALTLSACSDAATARRILANQGFVNIETTGYSFFACSKDDTFSTGFEATSPNGTRVKGAVCSGWMKGGTVRFF